MHRFLAVYAGEHVPALQAPEQELEQLEEAISDAEGDERRALQLQAAVAHLLAAEATEEEEEAERHLRAADQMAQRAGRRTEDPELERVTAFIRLWCAWRLGKRNSGRLLDRFARDHRDDEQLMRLVWAIRGERHFESEEWDEAMSAFRELVGNTDDPLYVMSQYRTGQCLVRLEQGRRGRQALREVRNLGCDLEAPAEIRYLAALAAVELETPLHRGAGGRSIPATCTQTEE
jgi:hypothetical protein